MYSVEFSSLVRVLAVGARQTACGLSNVLGEIALLFWEYPLGLAAVTEAGGDHFQQYFA